MKFKFIDIIKLSDEELKNIKLIFNSDWEYDPAKPNNAFEYIQKKFGSTKKSFNLMEMYLSGEEGRNLVKESTKLHNPDNKRFRNGELVFCFIPCGSEDWLLVNAFKVLDDSKRLVEVDEEAMSYYNDKFANKLVITWKNRNTRNIRMKDIEKIEKLFIKDFQDQPYYESALKFPGYKNVALSYPELKGKLQNSIEWQSALKARKGVYLITDANNGKMYVGSAYGKDGIYGRWKTYMESGFDKNELENGKYPNKKFQEIVEDKNKGMKYIQEYFHYTLLETFVDEVSDEDIIARETWWKERFQTKTFGYNAN